MKRAVVKRICSGTAPTSHPPASPPPPPSPASPMPSPASPTPPPTPAPRLPSPPRQPQTATMGTSTTPPPSRIDVATNTSPTMELNSVHGQLKLLTRRGTCSCSCASPWVAEDPNPPVVESPIGTTETITIPGVAPLPPSPLPRTPAQPVAPVALQPSRPIPNIIMDYNAAKTSAYDLNRFDLEALKIRVPSIANFAAKLVEHCVPPEVRRISNTRGVKGNMPLNQALMLDIRRATMDLYGIPQASNIADEMWKSCIKAVDECCRRLNRK